MDSPVTIERLRAGLTQEELACKIGLSCSTMKHYEQSPLDMPLETAIALSELFGCSVSFLAGQTSVRERF